MKILRTLRLLSVLALLLTPAAPAQTGGGATLVGTIKDATGAVVGGAKVTVTNVATAFVTEITTGSEGNYYVPYLAPGEYRMKVVAPGFKEFVRSGITLRSADVPRIVDAFDEAIAEARQSTHRQAAALYT